MTLILLENDCLRVLIAPEIGGRVVSLIDRETGREFLWRNPALQLGRCPPGTSYDPNFYGGIDELLPCALPETICGVVCPDHGELWTLALAHESGDEELRLHGRLPGFGLTYHRTVRLDGNRMVCDYRIGNTTSAERHFMWKLHVALAVGPGDRITCPAATARVADSVWSRCRSIEPFAWPNAGVLDVSLVPDDDGTTEFLYLYELAEGRMGMRTVDGASIECRFDTDVFPCCCYFASYGGMHGAVTSVLEPCTTMPVSVNDAAANGFCSRLEPGEELVTTVTWTIDERSTGSE